MTSAKSAKSIGYYGILFFGLMSLLADIVYEGGRSIIPELLRTLGASAVVVGAITGLGELIGYVFRLPSGLLADRSGKYWPFLALGYGCIFFIPALSLTDKWELVALFIFMERFGKAVRTPSRDATISFIARDIGTGKAFGIHEVLDQIGALIGPVLVSVAVALSMNNIRLSLSTLVVPALATMLVICVAYFKLRNTIGLRPRYEAAPQLLKTLDKRFWMYNLIAALSVVGFLHYSLIAYRAGGVIEPWLIPLLYAAAMGVDALAAGVLGFAYDRFKLKIFWLIIPLSALPAVLSVKGNALLLSLAILMYGVGIGAQESIYRSVIADLSPLEARATAYGVFNMIYGFAWLAGGFIMGLMYDLSAAVGPLLVAIFSVTCQLTAALAFFFLLKKS
ncbi:MAG: MFS transporter [Candidatus Jordarchaeales archaeon]